MLSERDADADERSEGLIRLDAGCRRRTLGDPVAFVYQVLDVAGRLARLQESRLGRLEALKHLLAGEPSESPGLLDGPSGRGESVLGSERHIAERVGGDVRCQASAPCSPAFVFAVSQADLVREIPARGVVFLGGQAHRVRERHEMLEGADALAREQAANRLSGLVEGSEDIREPAGARF